MEMKTEKQNLNSPQKQKWGTPISDKTNMSIDSEGGQGGEGGEGGQGGKDPETWIYGLGLLLDKKIPLKGFTNAQRIEIAVREYLNN